MTKFPLLLGAMLGAISLAAAPFGSTARAQPLPVERAIPKINNLLLKQVSPDEAERLAMPAKPIALRLKDVTLKAALEDLQKQSGVALDLGYGDKAALEKKLSLDFDTRFFQPAFDAIIDEAGVKASLQRYGRNETYNVQFGQTRDDASDAPQSGVGPFVVRLESVTSNFRETVKLSAGGKPTRSNSRDFSLSLNGTPDPIVQVTGTPLFIFKRVEDDAGRSLLDTNGNQRLRYDFNGNWGYTRAQSIGTPAPDVKTLARIEGTAVYVVPSNRQVWEIADVLSGKNAAHEFESNGQAVRVEVKSATREGAGVNMTIEMNVPAMGNNLEDTNPLFSFGQTNRAFYLEDANGQILRSSKYSSSSSSIGNKLTMRSRFSLAISRGVIIENGDEKTPLAEPLKLVFDGPTEWVQTEVPFSFTDVPLP